MNTYICYHGNCYDGFGAAFSAWKKFGDNATYIPCHYGKPLPTNIPDGSTVYMIDFSGSREQMMEWSTKYNFVVLDHHKTAEANLAGLDFAHFNMDKSGALLAWEYFHPETPVPLLIQHISDRDLWKHEMGGTREIHASLLSHPMDFRTWDDFSVAELYTQGQALLRLSEQTVDMICKKSFYKTVSGYKVLVVNATSHWSEVGNYLCKMNEIPFAVSFYQDQDGYKWSLRSVGDFDVSEIAKKFGGGGHKNAAGCATKTFEEFCS